MFIAIIIIMITVSYCHILFISYTIFLLVLPKSSDSFKWTNQLSIAMLTLLLLLLLLLLLSLLLLSFMLVILFSVLLMRSEFVVRPLMCIPCCNNEHNEKTKKVVIIIIILIQQLFNVILTGNNIAQCDILPCFK